VKKAQGTYRPDRAARNELVSPPGAPSKPADLPPVAAAYWDEIVPLLLERGTLSPEDGACLRAHVRAYGLWHKYAAESEARPLVEVPPYGMRPNPASAEAVKWEARLTQTGDRLGLNAAARSRVSAPEKPGKKDDVEKDLFGEFEVIDGGKVDAADR